MEMPLQRNRIPAIAAALCVALVAGGIPVQASGAVNYCGSLQNAVGPYDYRDRYTYGRQIELVRKHHLSSDVMNLVRGQSSTIPGDLDFALRIFPNHHPALDARARYELLHPLRPADATYYSAECYFERALRFRPDDAEVRLIYGTYLHRAGRKQDALTQYREALKIMPKSAGLNYNLGLLYLDLGELDAARRHAEIAYRAGFPLLGLQRRLQQAGVALDTSRAKD